MASVRASSDRNEPFYRIEGAAGPKLLDVDDCNPPSQICNEISKSGPNFANVILANAPNRASGKHAYTVPSVMHSIWILQGASSASECGSCFLGN